MGGAIPSTVHKEAAALGKSFSIESAVLKACSVQKLLLLKFRCGFDIISHYLGDMRLKQALQS
jgi:hypothetical protein